MTPEEYARALCPILEVEEGSHVWGMMVQQFRAAIQQAREDAAKIAEAVATDGIDEAIVATCIAEAIRSRANEDGK